MSVNLSVVRHCLMASSSYDQQDVLGSCDGCSKWNGVQCDETAT